jgi:hypothetical protein
MVRGTAYECSANVMILLNKNFTAEPVYQQFYQQKSSLVDSSILVFATLIYVVEQRNWRGEI